MKKVQKYVILNVNINFFYDIDVDSRPDVKFSVKRNKIKIEKSFFSDIRRWVLSPNVNKLRKYIKSSVKMDFLTIRRRWWKRLKSNTLLNPKTHNISLIFIPVFISFAFVLVSEILI